MSTYPNGHELRGFFDPQSEFGTRAADAPVGADAVLLRSLSVTPSRPSEASEDRYGAITEVAGYDVEMAEGAEWSAELDVNLSGSVGTDPDFIDLLTSGGWTQDDAGGNLDTTANGSNSHTSTTSTIGVASTTTVSAGDAVAITVSASGVTYLRYVSAVASGTSITVKPALVDTAGNSIDPGNGDTVKSVAIFSVDQDRTDANALTIWGTYDNHQDVLTGAAVQQETWSLSASQTATLGVSGFAQSSASLGYTTLDGDINNSVTSLDVNEPVLNERALPAHYLIGTEVVEVTAISSDGLTWTVTRGDGLGASAASHSSGAAMTPYRPSPTYATAKVSAKCGAPAVFDEYALRLQSAQLQMEWGVQEDPQELGSCYTRPGYSVSGKVVASISFEGLLRRGGSARLAHQLQRREEGGLIVQQGDVEGAMFAVYMPKVRLDEPARTTADKVGVSFSGRGKGASLTNPSPVYLIIG